MFRLKFTQLWQTTKTQPSITTSKKEREQKIFYHMVGSEITAHVAKNQVAAHVTMD